MEVALMKTLTEREYRALERDSYSSLKAYADDRKGYYKRYVTKEKKTTLDSDAMVMGSLVDTLLFSEDEFDERFIMTSVPKPIGQMGELVDKVYEFTLEATGEEGQVTRNFEVLFEESFQAIAYDAKGERVKFKGKGKSKKHDSLEDVLERFREGGGEDYYRELRNSTGKSVIDTVIREKAERIVHILRTNFATKKVINLVTEGDIEVFDQFGILFDVGGFELKCLLDKMIINHRQKVISPMDLKVTWNVEEFGYNYLQNRYYIQNGVYVLGCEALTEQAPQLKGYTVRPLRFITTDASGYYNPLIHHTSEKDIEKALEGFSINGKKYKGVYKLVEELKYSKDMDLWDISKDNHTKKGQVQLDIRYDD